MGKPFALFFDKILNKKLKKSVNIILAAADEGAIEDSRKRSDGVLDECKIQFFRNSGRYSDF